MTRLSPQGAKLLDILTTTSGITPILALTVYQIGSLSKRVSELRSKGYVIEKTSKHDGFGREYVEYKLVKTPTEKKAEKDCDGCGLNYCHCAGN